LKDIPKVGESKRSGYCIPRSKNPRFQLWHRKETNDNVNYFLHSCIFL
jgi:hypothetical protein